MLLNKLEEKFIKERYGIEKVSFPAKDFTETGYIEPLFEKCYLDLGFEKIESNDYRKTPDYFGWVNGKKYGVELERTAKNFIHHGHDPRSTDFIVCLNRNHEFEEIIILEIPQDLLRRRMIG